MTTQAPPRRRRRLGWLTPPLLLAALLVFLRTDLAARSGRQLLEQVLEHTLGEQVTIGRVYLEYWPPRAGLEGLVLTHPSTGETIAVVRELSAALGVENWRPVLQRIELHDPIVTLHVDPDGLREFRGLPKGKGEPATRFPWRELLLQGGQFHLVTPKMDLQLTGIYASPDGPDRVDLVIGAVAFQTGKISQHAQGVVFEDVILTPQRLVLPSINLHTEALTVEGSLAAQVGAQAHGLLSLHLDLPALIATLGHPGTLQGAVDLDLDIDGPVKHPGIEGVFAVVGLGRTPMGALPSSFGNLNGLVSVTLPDENQKGHADISGLHWKWCQGEVSAEASLDFATQALSATARGEGVDLGEILTAVGAAPTPWVTFNGDVETTMSGTVSPFHLSGPFKIALSQLQVKTGPVKSNASTMLAVPKGILEGVVSVDPTHLIFDIHRAVSAATHGNAYASIGIGGNSNLEVNLNFPSFDLSQLRPLAGSGLGGHGSISGTLGGPYHSLGAVAHLEVDQARLLDFPMADHLSSTLSSPDLHRLLFPDIVAQRGSTNYHGRVELDFRPTGMVLDTALDIQGRLRDLSSIFVDLGEVDAEIAGPLKLKGEVYDLDGESRLSLANIDLYGEHFPAGHAQAWMDNGRFTLEEMVLMRPGQENRTETLLARGSIGEGWKMNMGVLWDGAALERLDHLKTVSTQATGRLLLDAHIGGTLFDPSPEGRLELADLTWQRRNLPNSFLDFHTVDGFLHWSGNLIGSTLATTGTLGLWKTQPYQLHADLRSFPLDTFYPEGADGSPITARLSGSLDLNGFFGDNPTPVDIVASLPTIDVNWSGHHFSAPTPLELQVHGQNIPRLSVELAEDGKPDSSHLAFEGQARADRSMQFTGNGLLDLDLVRAFAPGMQEAEGMVPVSLNIQRNPGAAGPPAIRMHADLKNAYIKTDYFPVPFENLQASIDASPDAYLIRNLRSNLGGGTFTSKEGTIFANNWVPTRYKLSGSARNVRVQYFDFLPPMLADADLDFDGPVDSLLLSGSIKILDMQFRERIDWESTVLSLQSDYLSDTARQQSRAWFGMDLKVDADQAVHLRNNVADADASASLRVMGDTSRPGMTGDIRVVPGGRVYLQEREFEVERAEMHYIDPYSYDPDLDFQLVTDISSQEQDYRIRYMVNGPYSGWTSTATSDPNLSQADINALLLFGVTREEMERGGYGSLGTALAVETGGLLSASLASSNPSGALIDRFIDRWTLVSGVTERGSKTVSTEPRLVAESSQIGGFSFTGEFSFGGDWYLSVERRIASRLYLAAYATTDQVGRSMPFAAFGTEFKLRWEAD